MSPRTRVRATLLLGILFSYPAYGTWAEGGIPLDTFAIRVAIAMVVAFVAVAAVAAILDAYRPAHVEPAPETSEQDDIEDAMVVDPQIDPGTS